MAVSDLFGGADPLVLSIMLCVILGAVILTFALLGALASWLNVLSKNESEKQ